MSEFSIFCKKLIDNCEMTIYGIAKEAKIERTSLNRMIAGKRLPAKDFVDRFCSVLRITPGEYEQLQQLYMKEKIGKELYQNRSYILKMLCDMDALQMHHVDTETEPLLTTNSEISKIAASTNDRLQGKRMLEQLISNTFSDGKKQTILTNFPVEKQYFFEYMEKYAMSYHKKVPVYHYLTIHSNPKRYRNPNCNLEILHNIFPWIISERQEYVPYYSYSSCMPEDLVSQIWIYYVLTKEYALFYNADLSSAICITNAKQISLFRDTLKKAQENMKKFVLVGNESEDFNGFYLDTIQDYGKMAKSIRYCPNYIQYLKEEDAVLRMKTMLESDLCEEYSDIISRQIFDNEEEEYFNVFSEQGLEYFCNTGCVAVQELANEKEQGFSVRERIAILEKMVESNRSGERKSYLCNSQYFGLEKISMELFENGSLAIIKYQEKKPQKVIFIEESSICEAFEDFFDSLDEMGLVYELEKSSRIIQKWINKLYQRT